MAYITGQPIVFVGTGQTYMLRSDQSGLRSLECILKFVGLLVPVNASYRNYIRALPVIFVRIFASVYEAICNLNYFLKQPKVSFQLVTILNESHHTFKAFFKMLILILFWWKSSSILRIMRELNTLNESQLDPSTRPIRNMKSQDKNKINNIIIIIIIICYLLLKFI
jgi:hypothetical protein